MLLGMLLLVLFTGIIAGSYPAWFISQFQPMTSIKGTMISGKGKSVIRNILVVFQFTIAIVLIILSSVIFLQMKFVNSRPLGFDKENIIIIPLVSETSMNNYHAIRDAYRKIPQVISAGASSDIPGSGFTMNGYLPEGMKEPIMLQVHKLANTNPVEVLQFE